MERPVECQELVESHLPEEIGTFAALWIEDIVYSAQYWLVRSGRIALGLIMLPVNRPLAILAAVGTCVAGLGVANAAFAFRGFSHELARYEAERLADAAADFRSAVGRAPARLEDLVPRFTHGIQPDPFGQSYVLVHGPGGLAIVSAGHDATLGTPDDIVVVRK